MKKTKQQALYAFIHIHKTGGSTLQWILYSAFGFSYATAQPWDMRKEYFPIWLRPFSAADLRRTQKLVPYLKAISGHAVKAYADLEEERPNIRYFTFLRNPIKLHASLYQYHVSEERLGYHISFDKYMDMTFRHNRQCEMLCGKQDADIAIDLIKEKTIFTGLVEAYDESLLILKRFVIPELRLGYRRRNVLQDTSIMSFLLENEEIIQRLTDANREDVKLYEWVTTSWYPEYKRKYGDDLESDKAHFAISQKGFHHANIICGRSMRMLQKIVIAAYQRLHRCGPLPYSMPNE